MLPEATVVLDVGKSRVKLLAISRDAVVLDAVSTKAVVQNGTLDTEPVWQWLLDGLKRLGDLFRVQAVVPTTHGATAALLGPRGLAVPVIDYERTYAPATDAAYDACRPRFAETRSPRLPAGLNLARQLYCVAHEHPDAWKDVRAVLAYPQYWSWRLTGVAASEVTSLGCHTDLWRPEGNSFSSLVAKQGWASLFPPMRHAWDALGPLDPALRLPLDCPVLCGIHDSNAAYLRYLAGVEAPFVLASTGTWMICFNSAGALDRLDPTRDTLANVDVRGSPVACSRFMGGREFAQIAGDEGLRTRSTAEDARQVIARGLFALPSFATTGGPFQGCRGRIEGEPRNAVERGALAAVYAALMTREAIACTGTAKRVYVDGPFAANDAFCAVLAAAMPEVEVHATEHPEGTAIGASLLAQTTANGVLPSVPIAARPIRGDVLPVRDYVDAWRERVHLHVGRELTRTH
jgi:sugar (pentulose or hexulose) kinase